MKIVVFVLVHVFFCAIKLSNGAMTMKQLTNSMNTIRNACAPKFDVSQETLDKLRKADFSEDTRDIRCYTLCVAQMAGTMTKKGEISASKTIAQIEAMLPTELKQMARESLMACKDVQFQYKDLCDRTYFTSKCAAETNPNEFMFP